MEAQREHRRRSARARGRRGRGGRGAPSPRPRSSRAAARRRVRAAATQQVEQELRVARRALDDAPRGGAAEAATRRWPRRRARAPRVGARAARRARGSPRPARREEAAVDSRRRDGDQAGELGRAASTTAPSRSAEAASMWCTSSISMTRRRGRADARGSATTDVVQPGACGTPARAGATSGVGGDVDVERDREERQPRHEVGCASAPTAMRSCASDDVGRVFPARADELAQQLAPGGVRASATCRPRTSRAARAAPGARARSSSSSRVLPMPGSPDDLDERAARRARVVAARRRAGRARASRPTSGKSAIGLSRRRDPVARPDATTRCDGLALPFTMNGSSAVGREARRRSGRARRPVARSGPARRLGHQPRREVHGVAHDRVGAAVGGPMSPANTGRG